MSFFDHPQKLSRKNAYFAALNSHRGFVSYFPSLFAPYRKLIIKGGPGSGKSTLMKKVAFAAEEKGYLALRYYCSSDTDSLDAVAIPALGFVIIDGTPPHVTEPEYPGAKDEILDLTAFWHKSLLQENLHKVAALNGEISSLYRRAYALMNAANAVRLSVKEATESAFLPELCEKILDRFLDKYRINGDGKGQELYRPTYAFGVKGYVTIPAPEKIKIRILVKDRAVFAERFFTILRKKLLQRGVTFYATPMPITEEIGEILLPQNGILFSAYTDEKQCDGILNLDRMLKERGKGVLTGQKVLLKTADALCEETAALLGKSGKLHDALETFYIAATDYPALDAFTEDLIKRLF